MYAFASALARASVDGGIALLLAWIVCRFVVKLPPTVRCWVWRLAFIKLCLGLLTLPAVKVPVLQSAPDVVSSVALRSYVPLPVPAWHPASVSPDLTVGPAPPLRPTAHGVSAMFSPHENGQTSRTGRTGTGDTLRGGAAAARAPRARAPLNLHSKHVPLPIYRSPLNSSTLNSAIAFGVGFWALGVALGLYRMWGAWSRTRQIRQLASPVDVNVVSACAELSVHLGIRRPPAVKAIAGIASPMLVGIRSPEILLPADVAATCPPTELRSILAHELAHLKRRDLCWRCLPLLARTLFFFHPLVWLCEREWELAQEVAADALAVEVTQAPVSRYGGLVLRIATIASRSRTALSAAAAAGSPKILKRRLAALEFAGVFSRVHVIRAAAILTAVALLGLVRWQLVAFPASGLTGMPLRWSMSGNAWSWIHVQRPGRAITGVVLSPTGGPVSGATVTWTISNPETNSHQTLSRVMTVRDGRFRFDDGFQLLASNAKWSSLVAQAAGLGTSTFSLNPSTLVAGALANAEYVNEQVPVAAFGSISGDVAIRLPGLTTVRLHVVDTLNRPITGVSLTLQPFYSSGKVSAVTDRTGLARFAGLPRGEGFSLSSGVDTLRPVTGAITLDSSPMTDVGVVLEPAAAITGRVVNQSNGKPISGLWVTLGEYNQSGGVYNNISAMTDANGRYVAGGLVAGTYSVNATQNYSHGYIFQYSYGIGKAHTVIAVTGKESVVPQIAVTVPKSSALEVKVVSASDGAPIQNAYVAIYQPGTYASSENATDSHGVYRGLIVPGKYFVQVEGSSVKKLISVAATGTTAVLFPVPPTVRRCVATVVDPEGHPVPLAIVHVHIYSDDAFTDAKGQVDLQNGANFRVQAGDMGTPHVLTAVGGTQMTVRLMEHFMAGLAGTVVDERGNAVPAAVVTLTGQTNRESWSVSATTDLQGRYAFGSLWPDAGYLLEVTKKRYGWVAAGAQQADDRRVPMQLQPGVVRTLAPIVLPTATSFVEGRVIDDHGAPLAGADVILIGRHTSSRRTVTDRRGQFLFEHVVREPMGIRALCAGSRSDLVPAQPFQTDVVVKLNRNQ